MSCICVLELSVPSQDSEMSCIHLIVLTWSPNTQIHDISLSRLGTDTTNTQIHDISLSWLDTPNTKIHDIWLFWLDTPNTEIHDISLFWLGTDTPKTQTYDSQDSEMSYICVLGESSEDNEMSYICVLGVSSQDNEMSCICVRGICTKSQHTNIWHLTVLTWYP
jgi:hypothetical protein